MNPHRRTQLEGSPSEEMILDGTKIARHIDRVESWDRGERIAPITIDMALTRKCDAACFFCYAQLQENEETEIDRSTMEYFLADCAEMGVRGISLVSDGESLLNPIYEDTIRMGANLGISMASGTNGRTFNLKRLEQTVPYLTYLRFNVSAGEPARYAQIMGMREKDFHRVMANIRDAVTLKRNHDLDVTIGIQMVLTPTMGDQIMPFAKLGRDLGVDYAIIKHCSDDEYGTLGIDYDGYDALTPLLKEAESLSTEDYSCQVKWSKIGDRGRRRYSKCYGPPFLIQISGTGLVAPCGMLFNARYAKTHIGNITTERWIDIWKSDHYWRVMDYLGSDDFDPRQMCGALCLQHKVNEALFDHREGTVPITAAAGPEPMHVNFV
jgi:MoaA/NifB/PqqE/SkfB family radical SAM enzyme